MTMTRNVQTTIMAYDYDHAWIIESNDRHDKEFFFALDIDKDPRVVGHISRKRSCRKLDVTYKGKSFRCNNWFIEVKDFIANETNDKCYSMWILGKPWSEIGR
jgi:hypothetical protein